MRKKGEQKCPNFLMNIQLFQFATNFFGAEPETGQEGKGDFVLEHRSKKCIWSRDAKKALGAKMPKREQITNFTKLNVTPQIMVVH